MQETKTILTSLNNKNLQNSDISNCSPVTANISGGVSNTPPLTYNNVLNNKAISQYLKNQGNTLNDKKDFNYKVQIDWITITFDCFNFGLNLTCNDDSRNYLDELIGILCCGFKIDDFELSQTGKMGYRYQFYLTENINIYFYGPLCKNGQASVMLDITGKGMGELSTKQLYNLFNYCLCSQHLGKITRLDPGIDNFTEKCSVHKCFKKIEQGLYISSRKVSYFKTDNGDDLTIYFGFPSNFYMRIYEKNAEMAKKEINFVKTREYWTRYEIQSRDDTRNYQFAVMFCLAYERNDMSIFSKFVAGVIGSFVEFKEKRINDKEIKDFPIWKEWHELLQGYENIQLYCREKSSCSLDTKIDWINRSALSTLAQIYVVYGHEIFCQWLFRGIGQNIMTFEEAQKRVIEAKNKELGQVISSEQLEKIGSRLLRLYEDFDDILKCFIKK